MAGSKVALCAARWLGIREGSREHQEILDSYNAIRPLPRGYTVQMTDPWCAAFASAAAVMAGEGERYPLECSCSQMIARAEEMGIWVENDAHVPIPGDWVLYNWQAKADGDDSGAPDHVGVVIAMEGDEILAVEGNYDNSVKLRRFPLNWEKIRGFVCPSRPDGHFHTIEEVPGYARETIDKLVSDGSIRGVGENDLSLTEDMIRILVILDRRGKL